MATHFDKTCSFYSTAASSTAKFAFYPSICVWDGIFGRFEIKEFVDLAIGCMVLPFAMGATLLSLPLSIPTFVLALIPALFLALTAPFALSGACLADAVSSDYKAVA